MWGSSVLPKFLDLCVEAKGNDCKRQVENHLNISDRKTTLVFPREVNMVSLVSSA